jgi:soluble lytic murein transglycosylase-like protein
MSTLAGGHTPSGRPGALRRPIAEQGPSRSILLAVIPAALFGVLAASGISAFHILQPSILALRLAPADLFSPSPATDVSSQTQISPVFTPSVLRWSDSIDAWSDQSGLDANLIAAVMQIESCGDPHAASPSGALGLFQVMPDHFRPGDDPFDPDTNARRGLEYLSSSFRLADQDPGLAMAGYNGGHSVIALPPADWPSETRRYVDWGTGILSDIASGQVRSPTLDRWLQAGGASLCLRAQGPAFAAASR